MILQYFPSQRYLDFSDYINTWNYSIVIALDRSQSMKMARLSGLQREVLALYRNCLRESRKKPQATRSHFESFARHEFSRNLAIDKRDFAAIEFLLRKGRRQLEVYGSPGIKDIK
ncbi:Complex 1 LYR [Fusarium coicis]|nr:Complex 1 LYR [Fusarium coicis]